MGARDDFSKTHVPVLKLNDAAWTITCGKPDVAPISKQSLPKYALEALQNEGRVPDPLAGYRPHYHSCTRIWVMVDLARLYKHLLASLLGRMNEEELRWVALEVWTFTRSFDMPKEMRASSMASRELVLEGVDTVASVTLNGEHLADLQNAHRLTHPVITYVSHVTPVAASVPPHQSVR